MKKLLALFLIVPALAVSPIFFAQPAYACDGEKIELGEPATQKAVLYTATHIAVRCMWQWGDNMTKITSKIEMIVPEAQKKYQTLKKQNASKEWFKDFGNWFEYYENGVWYAVGYYTQGQMPFVKPKN
jgi:hypothetical protein